MVGVVFVCCGFLLLLPRVVLGDARARCIWSFFPVARVIYLVILVVKLLLQPRWHRLSYQVEFFPESPKLWSIEHARVVDLFFRSFIYARLLGLRTWRDAEEVLSSMRLMFEPFETLSFRATPAASEFISPLLDTLLLCLDSDVFNVFEDVVARLPEQPFIR